MSKYTKGDKIGFNVYGSTIKGEFTRDVGKTIEIIVTEDFLPENIGKVKTIHSSHPNCKS